MARTVGEVAELAHVTVRTLHHYDEIGLVRPSARTAAGYRLYDDDDLHRLQQVLYHRELGFGLDEIARLLDASDQDRGAALRQQRELLDQRIAQLQAMQAAVDDAIATYERGGTVNDEHLFDVFGEQQRAWREEAQRRWGDTDAWRQSAQRTRGYDRQDWEAVQAESQAILEAIADVYRSGAPPTSDAAMDAVEAHRQHISQRFYDCPHEVQVQLGEMYVQDPRFRATYESTEPGLAAYVRDAIVANAQRARRR